MVVGGAQNSLQSVLDLMTYVMGVIISNPQVIILLIIRFVQQKGYLSDPTSNIYRKEIQHIRKLNQLLYN